MKSIIIIGGDKRQLLIKDILLEKGFVCEYVNSEDKEKILSRISEFNAVVLPLPLSKDKENIYTDNICFKIGIKDIVGNMNEKQILFAGSCDNALKAYLREKNIYCSDYLSDEAFVIYNAYLTAQGALRLLLENTEELIKGKKVLITGYGRVARALAETLKNNSMDVYISARNSIQRQEAECRGYRVLDINSIEGRIFLFDYVFNTVPCNIFTKNDIRHLRGKYFELASAPFGAEKEWFAERDKDYINGSALPGKYLPLSSAKKISEIISECISDRKGGD